jgi:hypothetical protein
MFEILEYCTKDNVLEREQYYIDLLKPRAGAALVKIAGSTNPEGGAFFLYLIKKNLGYKHSNETKEKMKNLNISYEVRKVRL